MPTRSATGRLFILFIFGCTSVTWNLAQADPQTCVVTTTEGALQGLSNVDTKLCLFKSVPFAAAPLGNDRFAPTKPAVAYKDSSYDASSPENRKQCMQVYGDEYMDEDCLYLDIYSPLDSSSAPLPVFVFIHGGAFVSGSKEEYDLSSFSVVGKIIAVAINYRLGPFAWLRTDDETPGNYGFLDQVQALTWIKSNIASFGGDPNKITISGQSAGANSVELHLISPVSTGLFHRAFIESPMSNSYYPTKKDAMATAASFAEILGCTTEFKACLLNSDSALILESASYYVGTCVAANNTYYGYNIDKAYWFCGMAPEVGNEVLPGQFIDQLHDANTVPIMIGTVWNEGLADSSATYNPLREAASDLYKYGRLELTQSIYLHFLNQIVDLKSYGDDSQSYSKLYNKRAVDIYKQYPYDISNAGLQDIYPVGYNGWDAQTPLDANYVYDALYHDKWYLCPAMYAMSRVPTKTEAPIYMYRFSQATALAMYMYEQVYTNNPVLAIENDFFSMNLYPSHGDDIPFFHFTGDNLSTDEEKALGFRMFSALIDFIFTGDPNTGPFSASVGTEWEKYDPIKRNMINLSEPEVPNPHAENVRESQCKFWEKHDFVFSSKKKKGKKSTGVARRRKKGN